MANMNERKIVKIAAVVLIAVMLAFLAANEAGFRTQSTTPYPQTGDSDLASPPPAQTNASLASAQEGSDSPHPTPESTDAADGTDAADTGATGGQNEPVDGEHTGDDELPEGENTDDTDGADDENDDNDEDLDDDDDTSAAAAQPSPTAPPPLAEGQRIAYITIDDGPSRAITPEILDILAREGIQATFFVLPHDGVRDIYQRILDEGHEIGNHSYSHIYSQLYNENDLDTFREDAIAAREFIWENFGYMTVTYRFPGGMMGRSASIVDPRRAVLEDLGYRYFDWNIDTGDANNRQTDKSAEALTNNVLNNTNGRSRVIVLMHDTRDKATTLEALPMIIEGLRAQGYQFDILRNYYTNVPEQPPGGVNIGPTTIVGTPSSLP